MYLSRRLAILLYGSAVAAVIVGVVAVYFMIIPRFFTFEDSMVRREVALVENALVQTLTGLHARARDWSTRPDVVSRVRERKDIADGVLPDQDLGALRLDRAALVWRDGTTRWFRGKLGDQRLDALRQRFLAHDCYPLWGVTPLSDGAAMFALEPIDDSCNAVLFAVDLDAGMARELEGITGLPVELVPPADDTGRGVEIERLGHEQVRGSFVVEDYTGEPAVRGVVSLSHPLYGRGLQTLLYTSILLLIIALSVVSFAWWRLRRLVFDRLARLHGRVREIAQGGDLSRQVHVGGRDELSELASDFNRMVDSIRTAQEELAGAREKAESANRAKSLFLANMSHELRTPMTAVLGYTDLMRRESLTREQQDDYLEIIQKNGDALLALISDVLDLSRIEAGEIQVEHRRFRLPGLLDEAISTQTLRAREKGLDLTLRYAGPVPDDIISDPLRLRQILLNLLGNAIKFTDAGFVELVVRWEGGVQPFLHVSVHDSGIGIGQESQDSIFRPFAQEDGSLTRRFGGSGLGLAISRELAQSLGGDVTVESEPDRGSVFHFWVRAVAAEGSRMHWPDRQTGSRRDEPVGKVTLAGTALVVEDNQVNRLFVRRVLESAGMRVWECANGREALDLLDKQGEPDLVVMDMQMPVMDGYQAARAMREKGIRVPVLALTANVMADDRRACLKAGCDEFIGKPVRVADLLAVCARLLRKR